MEIIFIEYNGNGKPNSVFIINKNESFLGYDFFVKNGSISCEWSSGNIRPFMNSLIKGLKPRKVWFNPNFRPFNNDGKEQRILTNRELWEMGYVVIEKPLFLEEIMEAIGDL